MHKSKVRIDIMDVNHESKAMNKPYIQVPYNKSAKISFFSHLLPIICFLYISNNAQRHKV